MLLIIAYAIAGALQLTHFRSDSNLNLLELEPDGYGQSHHQVLPPQSCAVPPSAGHKDSVQHVLVYVQSEG